jgi:hypothetical protein
MNGELRDVFASSKPGRQNGTKFKSTCVALNAQGDVQHRLVMGSLPITGSPQTGVPPVAGASLVLLAGGVSAVGSVPSL